MPGIHKLTARKCETAKPNPEHRYSTYLPDGGSLYLRIARAGSKYWVYRYRERGGNRRLRELGLGGFPGVSLAEARIKADTLRQQHRDQADPLTHRRAAEARRRSVPHSQSGQPSTSNGARRFRQPRGARSGLPDRP